MDRPLPRSRLSGLRLALVALLLFAMQPLLHAHAMGRLPDGHVGGVHAPGADFANAAVGEEAPAAGPRAADLDDGPSLDGLPAALAPQGYDAVIALHVLEPLREPERALAGLAALVRPGGVVLGGFPVLPAWLAPLRERRLRRTAKPFGHVSAFSPPRVERMALGAGLAVDFRAGAFGLRASGSALEDSEAWLRATLLLGAAFPGWPGEIYWRLRKLAPAAAPAKSPARGRASRETAAGAVST